MSLGNPITVRKQFVVTSPKFFFSLCVVTDTVSATATGSDHYCVAAEVNRIGCHHISFKLRQRTSPARTASVSAPACASGRGSRNQRIPRDRRYCMRNGEGRAGNIDYLRNPHCTCAVPKRKAPLKQQGGPDSLSGEDGEDFTNLSDRSTRSAGR